MTDETFECRSCGVTVKMSDMKGIDIPNTVRAASLCKVCWNKPLREAATPRKSP